MLLGAHLSIAGGLHNAILKAEEFGFSALQVFTKNQQQWHSPPLGSEAIGLWTSHVKRLRLKKIVSHGSYLINLASPDEALWRKSIDLFIEEMSRCVRLDIPYLVTHPGAHSGAGEDAGIRRVAAALDIAYQAVPDKSVTVCLEITAGQGSSVGHRLEHLAEIIARSRSRQHVGVCLDTAHLFAAGYDFRGRKYVTLRREIETTVGLRRVKVLHLNDSKKDLGSRVDRHEHIGLGRIGKAAFRAFMRDEAFATVPKVIETPKGKASDGREWDVVNVEALRSLA